MVHFSNTLIATAATFLAASSVVAHPGASHHHSAREIHARRAFVTDQRRALANCAEELSARGVDRRSAERRADMANTIREKRGLEKKQPYARSRRDLDSILATDHNSTEGYTLNTPESTIFSGNNSCILGPEVTQGPYYVKGEYIRNDIREDQAGVDTYVDIQIIDTSTCSPISDIYLDFWHANSTGVYSGIVANGNGDSSDSTNLDKTFLRGIAPTDSDGVVQFTTTFPGHYTSRATHIHIVAQQNGSVAENGTYINSYASHVGQIFFDQDLITEVELTSPYSTNTQDVTTNADDTILAEEGDTIDPFLEYVYIGDDVSDGILAWITVAINGSAEYTLTPAATLTADGGVEN